MGDIIVVGNITSDFFMDTKVAESLQDKQTSICYPISSKIFVKKMNMFTGGGGYNSSVSFSRLGLKPSFLGKITKDAQGKGLLKALRKEKIKFIGSLGNGIGSYSVILDSAEHHRTIFVFKGKDNHLLKKDFKHPKTKWYYFASMIGESMKTQIEIAKHAKKVGSKIAYNPSEYLIREDKEKVLRLVKLVDVLILNKEEADLIVGKEKVAEKIRALGPEIVCITDGKNGAVAYEGDKVYGVLPKNVKVKETAGAGDAFASGFLAGWIKRENMKEALEFGVTNAESVIGHLGATNNLLTWQQMLSKVKKNPHRIKVSRW
ncbi:carbohydrate kinase family protein [Nanoarchaeota archaeon]